MNSIAKQIIQDSNTFEALSDNLYVRSLVEDSNEIATVYYFDDGSHAKIFYDGAALAYVSDENLGLILTFQKTFTI